MEKTVAEELNYLKKIRGEDELTILAIAVKKGIEGLFLETIEELFIEGKLSKKEAVKYLGLEKVEDIIYHPT